ncbi:MAG: hypothetical protein CVU24_07540 [Betaproteobacteria bacterium HGW-Betaproteobacteria-18]|nr:MAG: hypothetical protein CVU24_07540 [Betaproteobacteria bacterium HGW-Betaproteobacteria-18]
MNTPTRQPPRFVPTLTEVIEPSAGNQPATHPAVDVDALMATIWQQIQPMVVLKLQQEAEQWLRATLAQQLQEINVQVQRDIESLVRQAVSDALTPQNQSEPTSTPANY